MSKTGFAAFLLLILCKGYSQQSFFFVLIQADNNQPFYARVDHKIVNSSSIGYLMIPQLKDSTYDLSVGFPKNLFPELKFSVKINKKDQDFQLKNLIEKGWALFNRQTQELIMPVKEDTNNNQSASRGVKEDNAFSRLMAGVVNDSSVLYNTFVATAALRDTLIADTVRNPGLKGDTVLGGKGKKVDTIAQGLVVKSNLKIKKKPVKGTQVEPTSIQKLDEQSSNSAMQLIYLDKSKQGPADTVKMVIPLDNKKGILSSAKDSISSGAGPADKKGETPALAKNLGLPVDSVKGESASKKKPGKKIVLVNSDCRNFASDDDVERLRLKVLYENNEQGKIEVSKKYFKTKCFSVKQIRILSDLFPSDEWRLKFFDAAYPFISDSDNFPQLAGLLKDESYLTRFKTLIPNP